VISYANEGFEMFDEMNDAIRRDTVFFALKMEVARREERRTPPPTVGMKKAKIGRNDPCPCGSGKKYKNCCGK